MKNEIEIPKLEFDYRSGITKVRGGWTKNKIIKELKRRQGTAIRSDIGFNREICKYKTPEEFAKNILYHGSGIHISDLKPSVALKQSEYFGGGYEEQYFSISTSKSKEIASNFTGNSHVGNVAPILLKSGTIIKELPNIKDSNELDDIIIDLWTEGVDAVVLYQNGGSSEQEVAILNPKCAIVGKPESFKVFNKKRMESLTFEELKDLWLNASDNYKELCLESWENSNRIFKEKYGKDKSPESKWNSKQQMFYNYHKQNVEKYLNNQELLNKNEIESFISNKIKEIENPKKKKQLKI